jgi:hypothetical protein
MSQAGRKQKKELDEFLRFNGEERKGSKRNKYCMRKQEVKAQRRKRESEQGRAERCSM